MLRRSLFLALLSLPALGQDGNGKAARPDVSTRPPARVDPVQEVHRLLLKLEAPLAPVASDLARSLSRLGPAASDQIVAIYLGAVAPPTPPEGTPAPPVDPYSDRERPRLEDVLLATLRLLPPGEVVASVRVRATGKVPPEVRMNGIRALGEVGSARALEAFLESLAEMSDFERARFGVEEPATAALAAILASDDHCWRELERRAETLPPSFEGIVVRGIARTGSVRAFHALAEMLRRPRTDKARLVEALDGLATKAGPWVDGATCVPIRELLAAEDAELQRNAAVVLGRLGDVSSVPALIAFLESEDPRVQQGGLWALEAISRISLPPEAARWQAWHAEEMEWLARALPELSDRLDAEDASLAVEAIGEISQHPLFRHKAAEVLCNPLARAPGRVAEATCGALAQLRSARAVPNLVEALRRPELDVRLAAGRALVAITGIDRPAEYDAWASHVRP